MRSPSLASTCNAASSSRHRSIVDEEEAKKKRSRKKSPREVDAIATRARDDSQIFNLTLDVNNLRQELYDLEVRRGLLHARSFHTRADSPMSILRVVGRYFRGFTNGYRGPGRQPEQRAFVESITDENLSIGTTGLGGGTLMDQWLLHTDVFRVRENVLSSAEILATSESGGPCGWTLAECVLESWGVLKQHRVEMVFPHL
jgi:hypothetical protein